MNAAVRDERFGPERRVRKRKDFLRIQSRGRKTRAFNLLVVTVARSDLNVRLGITVTTKIDKRSARRNRLKRKIRETFRRDRCYFLAGVDVVVIALEGSTELEFEEVKRQLRFAWRKAGLLRDSRQAAVSKPTEPDGEG